MIPIQNKHGGKTIEKQHEQGTVLVVDDEDSVRGFVRRILESAGYEVLTANDGSEGLGLLREASEVTLVILDLTLPKASGMEVYSEIQKINPGIPVLMTSGYIEEEQAEKFRKLGIMGFIQKPFNPGALISKVKNSIHSF